jgi:hypothetical protein
MGNCLISRDNGIKYQIKDIPVEKGTSSWDKRGKIDPAEYSTSKRRGEKIYIFPSKNITEFIIEDCHVIKVKNN